MKKVYFLACVVAALMAAALTFAAAQASACSAIPEATFSIDTISGLTAAEINTSVTGGTVNATGCDIGVYFSPGKTGVVRNATVFGAQKAGIVNNGARVTIDSNAVYQIGDTPLDGVQYGLAIYVYGQGSSLASGDVTNNTVWSFQKNGITVHGPNARSDVLNNTVIGEGPVDYIAQNGIEVGYGATTNVLNNTVFGMSYTGPNEASSAGVLLFGGPFFDFLFPNSPVQANSVVQGNNLSGNDIGVALANYDSAGTGSQNTPTKNVVVGNTLRDNGIFNTTGDVTVGYQAGVQIVGKDDLVFGNSICGIGYTPATAPPATANIFSVDATIAITPIVFGNGCF